MKIITNENNEVININHGRSWETDKMEGSEFTIDENAMESAVSELGLSLRGESFLSTTYKDCIFRLGLTGSELEEDIINSKKKAKKIEIKTRYMNEIQWTDDYLLWYDKKVRTKINTEEEDAEYEIVMQYWKESVTEYERCKAEILECSDEDLVNSVTYNDVELPF